jgi:hypothetical protein
MVSWQSNRGHETAQTLVDLEQIPQFLQVREELARISHDPSIITRRASEDRA